MNSGLKETSIIIFFIIASAWISNEWVYFALIGIALSALYYVSGQFLKSLWLIFIPVYLFYRAVHFPDFSVFIQFSDCIMALILLNLYFCNKELLSRKLKKFNQGNLHFALTGIVILGAVSSYFSKYMDISIFYLIQLVKFFLVLFLARVMTSGREMRSATINLILIFVLFNSILIILQKINGGPLGIPVETQNLFSKFGRYADESKSLYRPGGITTGPNEMATVLGISIPLIFSIAITKNRYNKVFIWVGLILAVTAVIFTAARAVWMLAAIVLPLVYYSQKKSGQARIPTWIRKNPKVLLVLVLVFISSTLPLVINRIASIPLLFSQTGGAVYRLRHLIMGEKIAEIFPFGVGMNGFQNEIVFRFEPAYYFDDESPAHNVFVEVVADFGIIGLPLFVWLFYLLGKLHFPYRQLKAGYLKMGIFWGVVVYILLLQVHPWLFERSASSLFWIIVGINDDYD